MKEVWFTLDEVLSLYRSLHAGTIPSYPHDGNITTGWFTSMATATKLNIVVSGLSEGYSSSDINNFIDALMWVIYDRHAYDYIYYKKATDDENVTLDILVDFYKALTDIVNVLELTLPKYIPLFKMSEEYSYDILAPNEIINSESSNGMNHNDYSGDNSSSSAGKARVNDTPQDGGNFNDDEHASNVTATSDEVVGSSSAINDGSYSNSVTRNEQQFNGSLMARMGEAYANFHSVILEWSNEFNRCFIREEQL